MYGSIPSSSMHLHKIATKLHLCYAFFMIRLPYLLTEDGICRLEGDRLFITDRRVYPFERVEVACSSAEEVAAALTAMVTQGGGPLEVALKALVLQARRKQGFERLQESAKLLINSRPTNTTMARAVDEVLMSVKESTALADDVEHSVRRILDRYEAIYHTIGKLGSTLIDDGDQILTTCFAEHTFILSLLYAQEAKKEVRVLVSETRPYLQGSRLTAPALAEVGIPVKIITDNMGPTMIASNLVQKYFTAADLVCLDGTVVNKIGTLSNALAAKHYGIPYYALAISPDSTKKTKEDITIELRDPCEVTQCLGKKTTLDGIDGLYPAFDIVDPDLVTAIVTAKGILHPRDIKEQYI